MTDDTEKKPGTLSLSGKKTLSLKTTGATSPAPQGGGSAGQVRQSFSGGRTKSVAVEVRRTRRAGEEGGAAQPAAMQPTVNSAQEEELRNLTSRERETRARVLQDALVANEQQKARAAEDVAATAEPAADEPAAPPKTLRQREMEELERIRAAELAQVQTIEKQRTEDDRKRQDAASKITTYQRAPAAPAAQEEAGSYRQRMNRVIDKKAPAAPKAREDNRGPGRLTVTQVLNEDYERDRGPSLSALRRHRQKERVKNTGTEDAKNIQREIIVPETITVQDLANRMAERAGNLIKSLMKMGVMATVNQSIDADTAELLVTEFGHKVKRVTEGDVEIGIEGESDTVENLVSRPPVVTIMGHVDHGKTSLLDALRQTNVVAGEAGGITQHIGAYQVTSPSGQKITFLDTPGHAAFSEMRARGANVTDIVVLVVAANDGIMPQTIEAINHAKAAGVPLIVAINKVDLPDANPTKVKQELLQHEIIVEDMGGETLAVEVSAKKRMGLDKLEEAIILQSEILDLKANPNRHAVGTVIESRMEIGRGPVATVLIDRGTLKVGDIFVSGSEWGRIRLLINDQGQQIKIAIPGQPVEIVGLNGAPDAGDDFVVVENEAKARDITEYRTRKKRDAASVAARGQTMEAMFAKANETGKVALAVIIKADVHGSVEAIAGSLRKIAEDNADLNINILHTGVGGITESDVSLAGASRALIIGFNVRANAQARDMAGKNGTDIRYYSIIYNVIDDVKAVMGGMLSPNMREEFIGNAEIRQVFNITKVGKIAGCMVTTGFVKRGAKVRLLRDNVVIHEGKLKTLKRFKDEVKEVKEGTECGMAFEAYDDIREGDTIECFDVIAEQRSVA